MLRIVYITYIAPHIILIWYVSVSSMNIKTKFIVNNEKPMKLAINV